MVYPFTVIGVPLLKQVCEDFSVAMLDTSVFQEGSTQISSILQPFEGYVSPFTEIVVPLLKQMCEDFPVAILDTSVSPGSLNLDIFNSSAV